MLIESKQRNLLSNFISPPLSPPVFSCSSPIKQTKKRWRKSRSQNKMELSNQEADMPLPINSSYGGGHQHGHHGHGHMIHHHDHSINIHSSSPQIPTNNNGQSNIPTILEDHQTLAVANYKRPSSTVKYKECLKNHAASIGGNATDGCGEFMPSGEEGSMEALTCSACNCHRNFHRKEVEGENEFPLHSQHLNANRAGRKFIFNHHKNIIAPEALAYSTATGTFIPTRTLPVPPHQMIMSYQMPSLPSESDEQEGGGAGAARAPQMAKKRFRTKFSQEQKEKMLNFAEKIGWKMQKQEEGVVQQFCQEIGVKRRVLKVWMHNNKHNLATKNPSSSG